MLTHNIICDRIFEKRGNLGQIIICGFILNKSLVSKLHCAILMTLK